MKRALLALLACCLGGPAHAQFSGPGHLDILLGVDERPGGLKLLTGVNGDLGYYVDRGLLPVDAVTGHRLYPGRFGEFPAGGGFVTGSDDPGFQAFNGTFGAREPLHFRVLGGLEFWDPRTGVWGRPAGGEHITLFGALPPELAGSQGCIRNPSLPGCAEVLAGSRIHADGVTGLREGFISRSSSSGGFHSHLDWYLGDSTPVSPARKGAYLVTLELFSTASTASGPKYLDSDPIKVLFGHDLTSEQFLDAFEGRAVPDGIPPRPPVPRPFGLQFSEAIDDPSFWIAYQYRDAPVVIDAPGAALSILSLAAGVPPSDPGAWAGMQAAMDPSRIVAGSTSAALLAGTAWVEMQRSQAAVASLAFAAEDGFALRAAVSPAPEPSTVLLLAAGLLLVWHATRRRHARTA